LRFTSVFPSLRPFFLIPDVPSTAACSLSFLLSPQAVSLGVPDSEFFFLLPQECLIIPEAERISPFFLVNALKIQGLNTTPGFDFAGFVLLFSLN